MTAPEGVTDFIDGGAGNKPVSMVSANGRSTAGKFSASGGKSTHTLLNAGDTRVVFKVKCSNNREYRIKPVYGFVDPIGSHLIFVVRLPGPVKDDKMVVQFGLSPPDVSEPVVAFKKLPPTGLQQLTIPFTVVAGAAGAAGAAKPAAGAPVATPPSPAPKPAPNKPAAAPPKPAVPPAAPPPKPAVSPAAPPPKPAAPPAAPPPKPAAPPPKPAAPPAPAPSPTAAKPGGAAKPPKVIDVVVVFPSLAVLAEKI
ncbi:MSP domain protein [Teladorsagia circumcincta]|uniref:Major sperm protein n=1 Tax=Teladorsagia circumcincta TaxID=45464 RepID=A0A2G9UGH6_TELCI|nr:MSP domain protein [Teladorsagia circumcincta]